METRHEIESCHPRAALEPCHTSIRQREFQLLVATHQTRLPKSRVPQRAPLPIARCFATRPPAQLHDDFLAQHTPRMSQQRHEFQSV